MLRIFRDDGWEYRRADFGTTDGDKRFAFTGRRLSGYILSPSSRACPGTLACPGTYSKRPRSKNNHRWMFPRSRISVIPGSTRDLRDDGWEHRRADFGTTSMLIRPCSVIPDLFRDLGSTRDLRDDGRGLNRNHLIAACGFGVV